MYSIIDKEFSNDLHVPSRLFEKWGVARSFESDPFHLRNFVEKRLHDEILSDIHAPVNDESWSTDEMKTIDDRPILQDAMRTSATV